MPEYRLDPSVIGVVCLPGEYILCVGLDGLHFRQQHPKAVTIRVSKRYP